MDEKSMTENLVEIMIGLALLTCFMYGMLWAADKEAELGISGVSSERLLVQDELKEK